jgi:hypothetical protein
MLKMREEHSLQLRKTKVFDNLMAKRKSSRVNSSSEILPCEILLHDINDVPESLILKINNTSERLVPICKLFKEEITPKFSERVNQSSSRGTNIQLGLHFLRKHLRNKDEKLSQSEKDHVYNELNKILLEIFLEEPTISDKYEERLVDYKVKYECSWILINLLAVDNRWKTELLDTLNFRRFCKYFNYILEKLIDERSQEEYRILVEMTTHLFWIMSNVIDTEEDLSFIEELEIVEKFEKVLVHILSLCIPSGDGDNKKFRPEEEPLICTTVWTAAIFMQLAPNKHRYENLMILILQIFHIFIINERIDNMLYCLQIISYFTGGSDTHEFLLQQQVMLLLMGTLGLVCSKKFSYEPLNYVLKILSDLLAGKDEHINFILSFEVLPKLFNILEALDYSISENGYSSNKIKEQQDIEIIRSVCVAISNVCASPSDNVSKVILNEKYMKILSSIYNKMELKIHYEILYIYSNAFHCGGPFIQSEMIKENIHKLFIDQFQAIMDEGQENNPLPAKCLLMIMRTFSSFLHYGAIRSSKVNFIKIEISNTFIVDYLVSLTSHKNQDVFQEAEHLINTYWPRDEEENYYDDYENFIKNSGLNN